MGGTVCIGSQPVTQQELLLIVHVEFCASTLLQVVCKCCVTLVFTVIPAADLHTL